MVVENAAYPIRKISNYKYENSQSPLSYPLAFMRGWCSAIQFWQFLIGRFCRHIVIIGVPGHFDTISWDSSRVTLS